MNHNESKKYAAIIGEVIVNECLDRKLKINTSKLMKLLYYMQKLHLQKYGEIMFSDEIIVTENGPYINDVANYFVNGRLGFENHFEKRIVLLDSHEDVVNSVLNMYGDINPIDLMKISVEDRLFKAIWADGKGNKIIIPFNEFLDNEENKKNLCLRKK